MSQDNMQVWKNVDFLWNTHSWQSKHSDTDPFYDIHREEFATYTVWIHEPHTQNHTHTHTHAHVYTHKSDNLLLDRTFIMKTKWKMFKLQNVLKKRRKKRSNID